jgi:hypothetical protein
MSFFKYLFSFLYVRNWHTGKRELSRAKVALSAGVLILIVLSLLIIAYLQAPVSYTQA